MRQLVLLSALLLLLSLPAMGEELTRPAAVAFYNEACGACEEYLQQTLPRVLREQGITQLEYRDYINDRSNRAILNAWIDRWEIPLALESHIMVFVEDVSGKQITLAGHIPEHLLRALFEPGNLVRADHLLLYQDEMHAAPTEYTVWQPGQPIRDYSLDTPLSVALAGTDEALSSSASNGGHLLPLVLISGLSDGVNPCAIAVLIFFVALLYYLHRSMRHVLMMGAIYILVIYLTYLAIGLGLLKAIRLSGEPHLMVKISGGLMILLGLVGLRNYLFPKKLTRCLTMPMQMPGCLKVPKRFVHLIEHWLSRATIPAVLVGAFLVGLCTFPCSGGIYVAILGLLASAPLQGFGYLLVYNLMFVVPLILLLVVACNETLLKRAATWQTAHQAGFRLASGMAILLLGVVILVFFV